MGRWYASPLAGPATTLAAVPERHVPLALPPLRRPRAPRRPGPGPRRLRWQRRQEQRRRCRRRRRCSRTPSAPTTRSAAARLDANLDVDLKGLARITEPLSLHLNGPFQSNGGKTLPDFALGLDLQGGEKPITVGAVFAGGGGYLTIEGQAFDLGADLYKTFKTGYEKAKASASSKSASDDQSSLSALGISPLRWLTGPQERRHRGHRGHADRAPHLRRRTSPSCWRTSARCWARPRA